MYGNKDQVTMCNDCYVEKEGKVKQEYCNLCYSFIESIIEINLCNRIRAGLSPYCDEKVEGCSQVIKVCDKQGPCVYKACNPGDACYITPACEQNDLECICNLEPNF